MRSPVNVIFAISIKKSWEGDSKPRGSLANK